MPYIGKAPNQGVLNRYIYSATAGQTSFTGSDLNGLSLSYSDQVYCFVYQNGVLLKRATDYTSTSGTSVVLVTGASLNDVVEIIVYDSFTVANSYTKADSDTRYVNVTGDTMTGALKTDTLTGTTTAGSIAVTGEGNSTTTNLQQGLGKFWSNWDGESTVATRDSFNQSSLTDNGTGDYTTAFTNNMSNDDYAHLCACDSANGHILEIEREAYNTTSQCRSYAFDVNPSVTDVNVAVASVLGDLA